MDILRATKDLVLSMSDWIGIGGIIAVIAASIISPCIAIWLTRKYLTSKEDKPLTEETERERIIKKSLRK